MNGSRKKQHRDYFISPLKAWPMSRAIRVFVVTVFAVCAVVVGVALTKARPDHPPHRGGHLKLVRAHPDQGLDIGQAVHAEQVRRMLIVAYITPTTTTTLPARVREQQPATTSEYAPNDFLACVKKRESEGQYTVVNPSGPWYGAYQFDPGTWNSTAQHAGRSDLVGVNPAQASPADQDAMAQHLLSWQGTGPWAGGRWAC